MRSLRWDPSYEYKSINSTLTTETIKEGIQKHFYNLKKWHVNTVFLYVASPGFGFFDHFETKPMEIERGIGTLQYLSLFMHLRKSSFPELKVVAVLPSFRFEFLWREQPSWRWRSSAFTEGKPIYAVLSPGNLEFRKWYLSLVQELIKKFPDIFAIEMEEPVTSPDWSATSAQEANRTPALNDFVLPGSVALSALQNLWEHHQVQQFVALVADRVKGHGKRQFFVNYAPRFKNQGNLTSPRDLSQLTGFDPLAVMTGPEEISPNLLTTEVIWQKWHSLYGNQSKDERRMIFSGKWTAKALKQISHYFRIPDKILAHVEVTPWRETAPVVVTPADFKDSLLQALKYSRAGVSVYDFHQLLQRSDLQKVLAEVYRQDAARTQCPKGF
jgi:hypothetical protein